MEYPDCFGDMGHKIYCLGYDPTAEQLDEDERTEAVQAEAIDCHACEAFEPCWKISLNTNIHSNDLNMAERLAAIEGALGGGSSPPGGFSRLH
jgi:hypothetical protein